SLAAQNLYFAQSADDLFRRIIHSSHNSFLTFGFFYSNPICGSILWGQASSILWGQANEVFKNHIIL
ncbi:hypothetical protein, partial [Christensenella hongkongensis]|uniref:hypothetical protein n=1 Tax=Christensenella hongkongensis TaxID=270498 RepID=UPI001A9A4CCD